MRSYATFQKPDDKPTLYFERRVAHPVEAVWNAITESDELAQWFPCAVELELRVGGMITFTFAQELPGGSTTLQGRVTDLDPPRLFAFHWGEDHLRFELERVDGGAGCLLRFTVLLDAEDKAARDAAGWHVCLDDLERQLDGKSDATRTGATSEWRGRYEEYTRRGLPTGAAIPGER
jgi:uncharacterized protein YndB with AHSA1/START domain